MSNDTSYAKGAWDQQSFFRRTAGDLTLACVVSVARLGALVRRWRKVDSSDEGITPGEVIVGFPDQEGRGASAERSMGAVRVALARLGRRFKVGLSTSQALKVGRSHGIRRRYLRVVTEAGLEEDVVRAIRVASWRSSLPRGRFGVIAIRSPQVRPAFGMSPPMRPPGPITFTPAYDAAKVEIGADHVDATGVTILVADIEPPDTTFLEPDVKRRVEVLSPTGPEIRDGHATMITAIVGDIANGASIKALAFGDKEGAGAWSLLRVLLEEHQVDLVVASVSLPSGTGREGLERDQVFDSLLRQRELLPHHPPMFFPTGNDDGTEAVSTIAIPARFEYALTIGAVDQELRRPAGSRFGKKVGEDSSAWWVVPGGSWKAGEVARVPLLTMDGRPQAGTSLANAIAAGLAAGVVARMKSASDASPNPIFEAAMRGVEATLTSSPGTEDSLVLLKGIRARHGGAVTRERLASELDKLSRPNRIPGHNSLEHGRGLLCLADP